MNQSFLSPTKLDDFVISNSDDEKTLHAIVHSQRPFPSRGVCGILLYGSFGTGKSTLAKLLPNLIERKRGGTEPYMTFDRCVGDPDGHKIVNSIENSTGFAPITASGLSYAVLDEADRLSAKTQATLRGIMDYGSTVFVFTTNNIQLIDKGIQDRSHLIEMDVASPAQWLPIVRRIVCQATGVAPPDKELTALIATCSGSARKILNAAEDLVMELQRASATP